MTTEEIRLVYKRKDGFEKVVPSYSNFFELYREFAEVPPITVTDSATVENQLNIRKRIFRAMKKITIIEYEEI